MEESGFGTRDHETLASKVFMGRNRFRVGGALWQLFEEELPIRTFTVRPRNWLYSVAEFADVDPRDLINRFRSTLNRAGGGKAEGFLIGAIHGEFDEGSALFDLHVHGAADREMLGVVDRLRHLPNYRCRRDEGNERPRVVIRRKALSNLPYPLTYIFQSSWPKRWRGEVEGANRRGTVRHRIPEPYHTIQLLWLDQWSLNDISLLMGAYVGKDGLILSDSKSYSNRRSR
ncbi:hypothetical protein [Sphingomonas mesophila]|uniref:hypothetical protein n=1 Tax=Sphingomonas mesophila TaxID=2303576 RepID=UPI0013C32ABB|nr:hypothetical protein [Sphingomonas mesophila]